MRLLIDARMLDHSGIGIYLSNVLPGVLGRCATLRPVLLTLPSLLPRAGMIAGSNAEVRAWAAKPLSITEILPACRTSPDDLWWSPHFNVPLITGSALVVTLHDLLPLSAPMPAASHEAPRRGQGDSGVAPRFLESDAGASSAWHKRLAVRVWLTAIRRRARRVICDSAFTRDEAVRLTGIPAARMSVVHLGVDPVWAAGSATRNPALSPYLVFVGLLKPHKNLLGLLQAFETLMPTLPHRLVVVGAHTGVRDVDRAALALAHRLGPRVEMLEDVSQEQLIQIVAGADLLVQPSFYEGFGLPPLEAMAAGTPVLAAQIGALTEVCGDAAVYCNPRSHLDIAEAIRRIVGDPALRIRMRERGREHARAYTWEACAAATSDALLAAASER